MSNLFVPNNYKSLLDLYDTQNAIGKIKSIFQTKLCAALHLKRITAPLFVDPISGLNDNLNGVERPVIFDIPAINSSAEVVHSLAKWKRMALKKYDFHIGNGIVTDMNAIRRDESIDNMHSIYVDQWDWEKVISEDQRTLEYLQSQVTRIVEAICSTLDELKWDFPILENIKLNKTIKFITSQELEDLYPNDSPKVREDKICNEYKTVFIMQIGDKLKSGLPHDGRAPDYDDWQLNGDLLFWNDILRSSIEISSMGIRVDAKSLDEQLTKANCNDRRELEFHKMLLNNELPLTIGGGIGQSRLCMLLLGKVHIGEVQVSLWDENTLNHCKLHNINLL